MAQVIICLSREDLQEMLNQAASTAIEQARKQLPQFYNTSELANILQCSRVTIQEYIKRGRLHPIRMGKQNMFNMADVEQILRI